MAIHHFMAGFVSPQTLDLGQGTATITGTAQAGKVLTATYNMDDPDGGETGISYQWYRSDINTAIPGATGSTHSLLTNDAGHTVNCQVTYTDGNGHLTTVTSNTTSTVIVADLVIGFNGQSDLASAASASPSFGSFSIGTASADRYVVVFWYAPSLSVAPSDLKINGVSATFLGSVSLAGNHSSMWMALVPTGTTCTVQGFYAGTPTNINSCAVWTITGGGNLALDILDSVFTFNSSGALSKTYNCAVKWRGDQHIQLCVCRRSNGDMDKRDQRRHAQRG
jgi:hypothetical protein